MLVPEYFSEFEDAIAITKRQKERIESSVRLVKSFADEDGGLSNYVVDAPFYQGSYAHGTIVRPLKAKQEYDIDVSLPMDFNRFSGWNGQRSADHILSYVATRLRAHYRNMTLQFIPPRVETRRRCVRINYAGEFHLDLVPMHVENDGRVVILDRSDGDLIRTNHPGTVTAWVKAFDQATNGGFTRLVRIFKRWRDLKFSSGTAPASLHLTLLVGYALNETWEKGAKFETFFENNRSIDAYFVDAANSVYQYLTKSRFWSEPSISIPGTNPEEDFYPNWEEDAKATFLGRLETLINQGTQALRARSVETTTPRWISQLGNDFPEIL